MSDVKRLLAEATPLPWVASHHHVELGGESIDAGKAKDAALIVYAVNRLPDYEAAVEALAELVDAATALENRAIRSGGEFHVWFEERWVTDTRDAARVALARLRESVPA